MQAKTNYDVIVIGAGPAGCAASALLAEDGASVLMIEKEKFPRYTIGESMIPYCYFPIERLGLRDKMEKISFVAKHSVQFVSRSGKLSAPFYFKDHMDHPAAATYQVERSDFDMMMWNNAVDKGVKTMDETKVLNLTKDDLGKVVGVKARDKDKQDHNFTAPITIDCTGRNALSASRNGWRIMDQKLKKIAVWSYFEGAKRDEGIDEGATTVASVDERGWFWYIPLRNNIVSVGVVGDKEYLYRDSKELDEIFAAQVERNGWIKDHLSTGKRIKEFKAIGDFSYRSRHCATDGLVLAGDAFSFLDPAFSSGLFLALHSGVLAADAVKEAREANDFSAARFNRYGDLMAEALNNMRRLVFAFYDPNFSFGKLLKKYPHLRGDVTDCLIGHLHRDFDELFTAMAEFADLPETPDYGFPLDIQVAEAV